MARKHIEEGKAFQRKLSPKTEIKSQKKLSLVVSKKYIYKLIDTWAKET